MWLTGKRIPLATERCWLLYRQAGSPKYSDNTMGLKHKGSDPEKWIKITTDTSIVDLLTQGEKKTIHPGI